MIPVGRTTVATLALAIAVLSGRPAMAQSNAFDCTYIRCFLKLQQHPAQIVRGFTEEPVARFRIFAPSIAALATAGDSMRFHYRMFHDEYNRGAGMEIVGVGVAAVSMIAIFAHRWDESRTPATIAVAGGGTLLGFLGFLSRHHAEGHLRRAIALYNHSLPDAP